MATNVPGIYAAGRHHQLPGQAQADRHRRRRGLHRGEQRGALHQSQGQGEPGAFVEHGDLWAEGRLNRTAKTASGGGAASPTSFGLIRTDTRRRAAATPARAALRSSLDTPSPRSWESRSVARSAADQDSAASSSIQGEWPTIATMASGPVLADVTRPGGPGRGPRRARRRAPAVSCSRAPSTGSPRSAAARSPGTGEHQRRREVALAEKRGSPSRGSCGPCR